MVGVPLRCLVVLAVALLGCQDRSSRAPTSADQTYGVDIDGRGSVPAPAVAAEPDRYGGHSVTIEGRIDEIRQSGCVMVLDAEAGHTLVVEAQQDDESACAWHVPAHAAGIAVTTGTLRTVRDTLRVLANGVRVTPVRSHAPDSPS